MLVFLRFCGFPRGGTIRVWDLRFYRAFEDWELAASYSLLQFIQSHIPRGKRSNTLCWRLKGDGKFDTRSYYHAIRVLKILCFLERVFGNQRFLLMLRGRPLANQCCMCCCDGESVDHLLVHCPVTHTLWTFMLQTFGIHWVMPGSVASLLFCWHQWLGKHNSNIWNLIPGCLMWIVWLERNHSSFEDIEKTLDELKVLCQRSLFEWSRCWSFTNYYSLLEFMFPLRLVS